MRKDASIPVGKLPGASGSPLGPCRDRVRRLRQQSVAVLTSEMPRARGNQSFWQWPESEFQSQKGEVHALVGENGAGKSTLMKILFAYTQPNAGKYSQSSEWSHATSDATKLNIGMVQHFMLVLSFTVAQNMILGVVFPKKALTDLLRLRSAFESFPTHAASPSTEGAHQRLSCRSPAASGDHESSLSRKDLLILMNPHQF